MALGDDREQHKQDHFTGKYIKLTVDLQGFKAGDYLMVKDIEAVGYQVHTYNYNSIIIPFDSCVKTGCGW